MKTYTEKSHISSVKEVEEFFEHLAFDRNLTFHPDDDFSDFTNRTTGERTFTDEEVRLYNRIMMDCFAVCTVEGADIYSLGLNTLRKRMGILMK